jgi:hypothetical protein
MKKTLVILSIFTSNFIFSQVVKNESNHVKYQRGLGIETFYQGNYGIGLGGLVGKNIGNKKESNGAIGIYTDLFFLDSPIIGPRVKMTYNYVGIFGVSLNFCNYYKNGINDFRVAADLNFSTHGIMTFFIGYGMKFSEKHLNEISQFRIGLNLNLVNKMNE